jgi:hypothetical protein
MEVPAIPMLTAQVVLVSEISVLTNEMWGLLVTQISIHILQKTMEIA